MSSPNAGTNDGLATLPSLEATYADYGAFLEHDMDVVVIASPPAFHVSQAMSALQSGKHVLCEVPAATTVAEAEDLVTVARAVDRTYMLAENANYFHWARQWCEWVKGGRLGKITYMESEFVHDSRVSMRHDDGRIKWSATLPPIHYCSHSLGPLLALEDDRCVTVAGMNTGSQIAPELGAIDQEIGVFRTRNGAVVSVLCSFAVARSSGYLSHSVFGTRGSLERPRSDPGEVYSDKCFASFDEDGARDLSELLLGMAEPDAPPERLIGGHGTSEWAMTNAFLESIDKGVAPPIDVYKGLDMCLPGLVAHESAQQGGRLLDIPDPRAF